MDWALFHDPLRTVLVWIGKSGYKLFLILGVTYLLVRLFNRLIRGLITRFLLRGRTEDIEQEKRAETLGEAIQYLITILFWAIALAMCLGVLGVNITPILTAAGVLGLAVGFGAQSLVKDLIGGFFILLDDQIRVGDVVEVAGKTGMVERMTLKMTMLRDTGGNVHFIPNGEITTVTNMTKGYSRYVIDVGVAYREDADEVMEVMRQVDQELRLDPQFNGDILEPLDILGVDAFADSAFIIKARITTRPLQQWRVGREFRRRLKKAFDARGIEIPYPHLTLYIGEDKRGKATPLRIRIDSHSGRGDLSEPVGGMGGVSSSINGPEE